jgi:TRAP-type uncharacterized transport system fused permease subunit
MNDKPSGVIRRSIFFIAVSMSLYHLYTALFGAPEALLHRATHLSFTLVLIFLVYPLSQRKRAARWVDFAFMGAGMAALFYLFVNYDYFITRYPYVHPLSNADLILGILLVVTLLEAARRSIGWAMPVTALAFLLYTYVGPYLPGLLHHPGSNTETIIDQLYMTTEGIFGIPLGVSATAVGGDPADQAGDLHRLDRAGPPGHGHRQPEILPQGRGPRS